MKKKILAFAAVVCIALACGGEREKGPGPLPSPTTTVSPAPTTSPSPSPTTSPSPSPTASPSPSPTVPVDLYVGPESVRKFVEKFVADALIQGVDPRSDMNNPKLQIQISSLDAWGSGVIGLCQRATGTRKVTLDPDFWDRVSDTQKELLMHHELGHCVLYRAHRTGNLIFDDGNSHPASIMNPIIMSSTPYQNHYDYYQEELFSQAQGEEPVNGVHICR